MNRTIYLAIIDDPTAHDADFDYTACETQEIAIDFLINSIAATVESGKVKIQEDEYECGRGLTIANKALISDNYVEFNGIYYRIKEVKYLY